MGLALPALATTTVTFSGSAASQNFGTVNIGSQSTVSLGFSVAAGTTVGSIEVVTQGTSGLDFTNAGTGSCFDQTYGAVTNCTVNVTFTPIYAGLRRGAVLFWSGANNTGSVVGKTFIYGAGNGGQIIYGPPVISSVATPSGLGSWSAPEAVAFNGANDLYVVDNVNNRLVDIPVSGAASVIGPTVGGYGTLGNPLGAEVDGAGDLIISDNLNQRVVILQVGGGTPITIAPGLINGVYFSYPLGIAVDGLGNIYITDEFSYRVLKSNILAGGTPTISIVNLGGKTLLWPSDVWLDAAGDLFISDFGQDPNTSNPPTNPQILEVFPNGTSQKLLTPGCSLSSPVSAEADPAGNIFIGDITVDGTGTVTGGRMIELPAGGGNCIVTTSIASVDPSVGGGNGANGPGVGQVNLNAAGDIYLSDYSNNLVVKFQRSVAPTVAFTHSTTVGTLDTTDGVKSVQITNIGSAALQLTEVSYPTNFEEGSVSSPCTNTSDLAENASCNVGIQFYPQSTGFKSESITLYESGEGLSQSITATGTGSGTAPTINSGNATTFTDGQSGSFTVTTTGTPAPALSESGALPSGIIFVDQGNGSAKISGVATQSGSFPITITASNGVGSPATQSFTLTVDQAPSITSSSSATFTAGSAGSFQAAANGYPAPTFSKTGALPSGVTLSTGGLLSGTPAAGTGGSYPISITASNGVSPNSTQSFTLSVNQAPAITSATGATFQVGALGTFSVTASGYPAPAFTETGGLPSGVTLTIAGLLSGTPGFGSQGDYPITITASNGIGGDAVQTFGLTVAPPPMLVVDVATDDAGSAGNCAVQTDPTQNTGNTSCSLRDALAESQALGAANIYFYPATFTPVATITLTNGTLAIPANTSIFGLTTGSGATLTNMVAVAGGGPSSNFPVFTLNGGETASIANLIVTQGHSSSNGGGILSNGVLTVTGSTFTGNSADKGGAITNGGTMTIANSTFSGNSVTTVGGAIWNGGSGVLTITDSTISGNSTSTTFSGGGGIENDGTLTINGTTISGNSAFRSAGGIFSFTPLTVANSIVAGNSAGTNYADIATPTYNDKGGNLAGTDASGTSTITPMLAPLGNYGGPTPTMVPLPGSAAICNGSAQAIPSGVTTDQRGFPNTNTTYTGYSAGTPCVDSGAVQTNYTSVQFVQQPTSTGVNATISPSPTVKLLESNINAINGVSIPLTYSGGTSEIGGTLTRTSAGGVATYGDLTPNTAGSGFTLSASVAVVSGATLTATSDSFYVYGPPALTAPSGSGNLSGPTAFTWNPGGGSTYFHLRIGVTGFWQSDLYDSGNLPGSVTSETVNIPSNGATLYVRLSYYSGGTWQSVDYTFTEAGTATPPALTAPTGAGTLSGLTAFTWSPGTGSARFRLKVGTAGPGSFDLYDSGNLLPSMTTETVAIPAHGGTVFVQLAYEVNGVWQQLRYTFIEAGTATPPTLTAPTSSSGPLSGSTPFTWNPGAGSTMFRLKVGTAGPGSDGLYDSLNVANSVTSETVTIPSGSATLYVQLGYLVDGVWHRQEYTFTEGP